MALRIVRENVYLPLPMGSGCIQSMKVAKDCFVSVDETLIPKWVLDELTELGSRAAARGLVIEDDGDASNVETVEIGNRVAYSVRCRLVKRNEVQQIHLSHIEPVDFCLCWGKDGKCYLPENAYESDITKPTAEQIASVANIVRNLLSKHKIESVDSSQANPYLLALIIPMSNDESRVKAFANDLFHELKMIPDDATLNVAESNHFCAFESDTERGNYLVIFNHPAIFDYPEDSPEGRCAYGML